MGILPKVINYKFVGCPLWKILAEAQIATRSCLANVRVGKLNLLAKQTQLGWENQSNWFVELADWLSTELMMK